MIKPTPIRRLLMTVFAAVSVTSMAGADEAFLRPVEGILLLKNGNVLQGMITKEGGHYVCAVNEQSLIRIPVERVEIACRDLHEAYEHRKARFEPLNLSRELDLLEWTLKVGLLDRAAVHLGVAARSEPDHPRVQQLKRRYQVALRPQESSPEESRRSDAEVQVSSAEPTHSPEPASLAESLHSTATRYFTGNIQPVLLNGCSATRCHGQNSTSEFQLIQFDGGRGIPRRLTLENLDATLRAASRDADGGKRFLEMAGRPHGGEGGKALDPNQLAVLRYWLQNTLPKTPTRESLAQKSDERDTGVRPASFEVPLTAPGNRLVPDQAEPATDGRTTPNKFLLEGDENQIKNSPPEADKQPKDPFDPEIFNRRFHSR